MWFARAVKNTLTQGFDFLDRNRRGSRARSNESNYTRGLQHMPPFIPGDVNEEVVGKQIQIQFLGTSVSPAVNGAVRGNVSMARALIRSLTTLSCRDVA
jgi:hypothetical protein